MTAQKRHVGGGHEGRQQKTALPIDALLLATHFVASWRPPSWRDPRSDICVCKRPAHSGCGRFPRDRFCIFVHGDILVQRGHLCAPDWANVCQPWPESDEGRPKLGQTPAAVDRNWPELGRVGLIWATTWPTLVGIGRAWADSKIPTKRAWRESPCGSVFLDTCSAHFVMFRCTP